MCRSLKELFVQVKFLDIFKELNMKYCTLPSSPLDTLNKNINKNHLIMFIHTIFISKSLFTQRRAGNSPASLIITLVCFPNSCINAFLVTYTILRLVLAHTYTQELLCQHSASCDLAFFLLCRLGITNNMTPLSAIVTPAT